VCGGGEVSAKTSSIKCSAPTSFALSDWPRSVIINNAFARRYWPGQNALGKHMAVGGGRQSEVVGVVKDANAYIFQKSSSPFFYLPLLQNPSPGMTLHVRSKGDPMAILPAVRNEIEALDQSVMLHDASTLSDHLSGTY